MFKKYISLIMAGLMLVGMVNVALVCQAKEENIRVSKLAIEDLPLERLKEGNEKFFNDYFGNLNVYVYPVNKAAAFYDDYAKKMRKVIEDRLDLENAKIDKETFVYLLRLVTTFKGNIDTTDLGEESKEDFKKGFAEEIKAFNITHKDIEEAIRNGKSSASAKIVKTTVGTAGGSTLVLSGLKAAGAGTKLAALSPATKLGALAKTVGVAAISTPTGIAIGVLTFTGVAGLGFAIGQNLWVEHISKPKATKQIRKYMDAFKDILAILERKEWQTKFENGTWHKHNVLLIVVDEESQDAIARFDTLPGLKITATSENIDDGYNRALCKFKYEKPEEINNCVDVEMEKTNCIRSNKNNNVCEKEANAARIANGLLNNKNA